MIEQGKKYLVTADNYFFGTDGEQYRAAYGVCNIVTSEQAFGFTPQRPSTNWFLKVGEGDNFVLLAGCQIHYVVRSENRPTFIEGKFENERGVKININNIFFTE